MKKTLVFLVFVASLAILFSSCKNKRTFFKKNKGTNIEVDSTVFGELPEAPEIKLHEGDVVVLSIQTKIKTTTIPYVGIFEYPVDGKGMIRVPNLGDFLVKGKTAEEAQEMVEEKVKEFLKEPEVKISIKSYLIQILGEVRKPGLMPVEGGKSISVVQALALAGNITDNADITEVKVIRQVGSKLISYKLDLTSWDVFSNNALFLQSGDIIYIPRSGTSVLLQYSTVLSTIAILLNAILLLTTRL